ncbi:hypothetical protein B0H10DRAFT_2032544 [Mycena sp. CBHHK59/15]|nr:hypothetical protein B0H10DRAFT_2032544 [Mycena sp. CBHHK59/15]
MAIPPHATRDIDSVAVRQGRQSLRDRVGYSDSSPFPPVIRFLQHLATKNPSPGNRGIA